jgi:hypothetical protein
MFCVSQKVLDFIVSQKLSWGQRMKKRMGRPPKPKSERKARMVRLRMSEAEYRKLEQKAKAKGLSVSEVLRQCGKD